MKQAFLRCAIFLICVFAADSARAAVTVPTVIGDNMVLQRDRPIPIWGQAAADEQVTVRFGTQEKIAKADAAGKWRVSLDPIPASNSPAEMTISASNTIQLNNILVGEVWLCSGQSNMEFPMQPEGNFSSRVKTLPRLNEELVAATFPEIRLFKVEKVYSTPDVTSSGWKECQRDSAAVFSAVGYFFGKELYQELKVPIGLIQSAWGGTRIEPWTPPEAYLANPLFKEQAAASQPVTIDGSPAGRNYQSMVLPLAPYALRGVIWYQGESNCINNDGLSYAEKMKILIDSWRGVWNQPEMPFYYVQIAPYAYTKRTDLKPHAADELPKLWEAQTMSLRIPNTGMAGTMDLVDDFDDIHPANKWDVGHRLALLAMAKDYGRSYLAYSGPMYKGIQIRDGSIRITFDYIGRGLLTSDGKPSSGFTIAGEDGKFEPANAVIEGDSVIVSSPTVAKPMAARFGWHETAQPNLINREGLPAIPFRTDSSAK